MKWKWTEELKRSEPRTRGWTFGVILLLTAAILVGGWLTVLQQVEHDKKEADAAAIQQVRNRAIAFEQYVARTFEAADLVSKHVGEKFIGADGAATGRRSAPVRIVDPTIDARLFAGVHAISPSGDLLASTFDIDRPFNIANHPVFLAHARHGGEGLQVSPPLPSAFLPGTFVHASRRIVGRRGETRGFVGVQIRPAELSRFLQDASFSPADLISVISLNGITLARREGDKITSGEDLRGKLVMQMQARNPNGTYIGPSSIDGHIRYFSHRRLPQYGLFVTAGISRDEVMAPVESRAWVYYAEMAGLTLASLLIATFAIIALTRRQRRAEALAEAFRRLKNAQRIAKIGDWEYDAATGMVLWSDELCCMYERHTGSDRLRLEDFRLYVDERDIPAVDTAIAAALTAGEAQSYEFKARLPSGQVSHRRVIAIPVKAENGAVVGLQGTDQDVTAEKLLASLQAQMAHLGRVDAMNMMASTLAHELNQPLTAASNYLAGGERIARNSLADQSPVLVEALQLAKRQIHLAAEIIRRVRDMLGKQLPSATSVSLTQVVDDALSLMEATGICARTVISRDMSRNSDAVAADPVQIQQVLLNLLRNACEAANEGENPAVSVTARAKDSRWVIVSITDNGGGIRQRGDDIFSPFASEKEDGLGLGLSISRTIVEYHGGRIWIDNSGEGGTTIAFTLPRAPGEGDGA